MLESLSVDFLKNLEDFNEEIDDVEVKLDGCHNVFLGTQSGHNHLMRRTLNPVASILKPQFEYHLLS